MIALGFLASTPTVPHPALYSWLLSHRLSTKDIK